MKQYNSYKDSGTPWIGQIPSHWEEKRMRFVCGYQKGKNPSDLSFDFESGMLPYLSMDYLRESTDNTQYTFPENDFVLCEDGDFLLLWDGSNAGEFLHSKKGVLCSTCAKLFSKGHSEKYFEYICKSVQHYLQDMTNGMGIPHVDANVFKNLRTLVPPISEQEAIASYLDKKCNSIDKLIATQEKRIALLGELKQSIITEAVTRGLNPDAPLKDSGIDWIGKIPEHWEVRRLKYWLKSPLMYGANEAPDNSDLSDPRYIRITDIDDNGYLKDDTFCTLCLNTAEPYLLDKGDILFARSGATVGKTYIHRTEDKACFAGYLIKAKINKEVGDCEYLYLYTKTSIFSNWKDSINIQATIQNIGADKYANLFITYPPISEQIEIAEFLKCQVKPLDSAITKAKREVELLREYKQTIITEAVTGKIKVC